MRIAVVAKTAAVGGVVQVLSRLSEALALAGHEVDLIFLRQLGDLPRSRGVNAQVYLSGWRAELSKAVGLVFLRTLLKEGFSDDNSPDPISWFASPFLLGLANSYDRVVYGDESFGAFTIVANSILNLRYYVVVHERISPSYFPIEWAQRTLLARSKGIFLACPSNETLGWPVGLPTGFPRFIPLAKPVEKIELPKDRFVLFDTRWSPKRDPGMILKIMEELEGIECIVAGSFSSGRLREDFETEIQTRSLQDRVSVRTSLSEGEVSFLYRHATAYVRWPEFQGGGASERGIGWGTIRAIESGCPPVLERRLGGATLIQDGLQGFIVEHGPKNYARALERLFRDPSLVERMALSAWELAKTLSIQSTAESLRNL